MSTVLMWNREGEYRRSENGVRLVTVVAEILEIWRPCRSSCDMSAGACSFEAMMSRTSPFFVWPEEEEEEEEAG